MEFVNTETRLGDEVISPQFMKELEHYYNHADIRDKAKCLELITSVNLGEELRRHMQKPQRPQTAMPAFGHSNSSVINPYQTSYNQDYPPKSIDNVRAIRPMTSDGFAKQVPASQSPGPTTYNVEFCRKYQRPASPERAGTASGNRNNRPHPAQSFMVWRFPHKNKYSQNQDEKLSEELANEKLNQITKRLYRSVYQNDYLGIPQGFQVKSAFNHPPYWKDNVAYGMESIQRQSYQVPFPQTELLVPTTRYGSNIRKQIRVVAAIPTANQRMIGLNSRTTYDRHYNDNAGPVVEQIRDVGKKLGADALKKHYMNSSGHGKELIGKLLEEYGVAPPSCDRPACPTPPSMSASNRTLTPVSTANQLSSPAPPLPDCRTNPARIKPSPHPASRDRSRSANSNYKPRSILPAATPILLPPPSHVQMPTTPLSAVYTPPLFLS